MIRSTLILFAMLLFAGMLLSASVVFAEDEICASCGQQVSVSGGFTHHKDGPSVTIEGTSFNPGRFARMSMAQILPSPLRICRQADTRSRLARQKQWQAGRVKGCLT